MNLEQFLERLNTEPNEIKFEDTMLVIESNYVFSETAFDNAEVHNDAGENSGSCRLFYFALLNELSDAQTLSCFGQYYHEVVQSPEGNSHQNIRQFMQTGSALVTFNQPALIKK